MLRFGETKLGKEKFDDAKKPMYFWEVNVDNTVM